MLGSGRCAVARIASRPWSVGVDAVDRAEELKRGRASWVSGAWKDAYESLSRADRLEPLDPEELEALATAAYMVGHEHEFVDSLERAQQRWLDAGDSLKAARCALWIGFSLALRGHIGPAGGWFGRSRRLVEGVEADCVERGWLLLPAVLQQAAAKDWVAVVDTAAQAAHVAERFDDSDLFALAAHEEGNALARLGRTEEGFALLDEAMVAAVSGDLSPIVTGLVYCGVIAYCQELYDLRRAGEWTDELRRWCEEQPQMVAYTGQCLVHRAEILQSRGAWAEALNEAHHACQRLMDGMRPGLAGQARYRQGELYRLQGKLDAAEEAYRDANRLGFPPQPGMALLRLAQGDHDAAVASIRRALTEITEPLDRALLLDAGVRILLAADDDEAARNACVELEGIADQHPGAVLEALAAEARGAVELASGDAPAALVALRRSWHRWQELDAPYEAARVRVRVGSACRALGDDDAAALEFQAARETFAQLGAGPDLARLDELVYPAPTRTGHGLTPRELEVLRLVAAGRTNKAIAAELVVSERTVDRHVSNILTKLDVASRAAATAYAYQHELV